MRRSQNHPIFRFTAARPIKPPQWRWCLLMGVLMGSERWVVPFLSAENSISPPPPIPPHLAAARFSSNPCFRLLVATRCWRCEHECLEDGVSRVAISPRPPAAFSGRSQGQVVSLVRFLSRGGGQAVKLLLETIQGWFRLLDGAPVSRLGRNRSLVISSDGDQVALQRC